MGEEQKGDGEKKEDVKKEEEPPEIILKVDMHCEGCARKVGRSLRKFEGVEAVRTESRLRRVVVKGTGIDPVKLCERVHKKTGRKAEIISPLPKPPEEVENKEDAPPPPQEENKEERKPVMVVLKVRMHCGACAQVLQKRIKKMEGVESVVTDLSNDQVTVTGFVDPTKLVENVYRRTRRQASIVQEEEKKEEKEEEEKNEESKGDGEKKEGGENDDAKVDHAKKMEYWLPKYCTDYAYAYAYPPPQVFSDENPNACSVM